MRTQKILKAMAICWFIVILAVNVFAEDKINYPDTYPKNLRNFSCKTVDIRDGYGFFKSQCTSYVAYKMRELGITDFDTWYLQRKEPKGISDAESFNYRWRHAYNWANAAGNVTTDEKIPVDNIPLPGDVAWWDIDDIDGDKGHVAFVEKVHYGEDFFPVAIDITEYNYKPCVWSQRKEIKLNSADAPTGFIHIAAFREGIESTYYVDAYEMSELMDFQTKAEWKQILLWVNQYRCKDCPVDKKDKDKQAYVNDFFDGMGGSTPDDPNPPTASGDLASLFSSLQVSDKNKDKWKDELDRNPGEKFDIRIKFKKYTGSKTISGDVKFYLSDDKNFDEDKDKYLGKDSFKLKKGEEEKEYCKNVSAPDKQGTYYIFARVKYDGGKKFYAKEYAKIKVKAPDYIVAGITLNKQITPPTFQPNQEIELLATGKNIGSGDSPEKIAAKYELFKADGTFVPSLLTGDSFKESELKAGKSTTHGGKFIAPGPGEYFVKVTMDHDNRVKEAREDNNSRTFSFTVAGTTPPTYPSFVGQCLTDEVQESSSACETHPVSISQAMSTAGSIDILPIYLRFSTGSYYFAPGSIADILADTKSTTDPPKDTILEYFFTPGTTFNQNNMTYISGDTIKSREISDGKTRTSGCRPFSTINFPIGDYTFGVMADRYQVVNEANESNNWLTGLTVHVGTLPDLETGELRVGCKKSEFTTGETVTLELLLKNTGIDLPSDAIVKFMLTDQAAGIGTEIGNITIPACSLQWREQQVISMTFTAPKAGSYTVTACANPGNLFGEEKADNNCASASMLVK